ncbi:MAG: hypothetical protein HOW73_44040 [Polyangiaceae bacterium]|nr:hypothetical protein [Polyangiaceae bacterium]
MWNDFFLGLVTLVILLGLSATILWWKFPGRRRVPPPLDTSLIVLDVQRAVDARDEASGVTREDIEAGLRDGVFQQTRSADSLQFLFAGPHRPLEHVRRPDDPIERERDQRRAQHVYTVELDRRFAIRTLRRRLVMSRRWSDGEWYADTIPPDPSDW